MKTFVRSLPIVEVAAELTENSMPRRRRKHALHRRQRRLPPSHRAQSPTQFMDSLKVYEWAHKNASSSIGGNPDKFFSIGGSAGATLALALANYLVADPSKRSSIRGCVAIVPATLHWDHVLPEYKSMYKSMDENVGVPIIDKETMDTFFNAAGVDPKDPNTFVALNKENHKNFPPTYIATCEADPLRDDGKILEECLKNAGVPVKSDYYAGLPHYFWIFPSVTEGQEFAGESDWGLQVGCRSDVSFLKSSLGQRMTRRKMVIRKILTAQRV